MGEDQVGEPSQARSVELSMDHDATVELRKALKAVHGQDSGQRSTAPGS